MGMKRFARLVNQVNINVNVTKCADPIVFSKNYMREINFPHLEAVEIKADVGGMEVRRLVIDNGSSCDIHFLEAFKKMRIKSSALKECIGRPVGFTCKEAPIMGVLNLPLILGEWPKQSQKWWAFSSWTSLRPTIGY